jgi:glutamine phosphoribosylpyrophosphate amidotransferase
MCSVVGALCVNPSFTDFQLLRNIFNQSQVRGLHATGISYARDGKVFTEKTPEKADNFQLNFPSYLDTDKNLAFIGHCRYSTSDLNFNQPISTDELSVAHNGVITQEPSESWKQLYGYDCETRNDTELLLKSILDGKNPLKKWENASIACCELHPEGHIRFYRNGKRPLYFCRVKNNIFVSSTADILKRAGISEEIERAKPNVYYKADKSLCITEEDSGAISTDLQINYEAVK